MKRTWVRTPVGLALERSRRLLISAERKLQEAERERSAQERASDEWRRFLEEVRE
jgi:hypothetical protein